MADNKYQMCPPLMSDSRHITNYAPNSVMNEYVKNMYGIVDNNYYRTFLQQNGNNLMKNEKVFMERHFNCNVPVHCSMKNRCNNFSVKRK
jgi:hypothetical protein